MDRRKSRVGEKMQSRLSMRCVVTLIKLFEVVAEDDIVVFTLFTCLHSGSLLMNQVCRRTGLLSSSSPPDPFSHSSGNASSFR